MKAKATFYHSPAGGVLLAMDDQTAALVFRGINAVVAESIGRMQLGHARPEEAELIGLWRKFIDMYKGGDHAGTAAATVHTGQ